MNRNLMHEEESIGIPYCSTVDEWIDFFQALKAEFEVKYTKVEVRLEDNYEDSSEFIVGGYRNMTEKELAKEKTRLEKEKEAKRKQKEKRAASKIIDEQNEKALYEKLKEKYEK